MTAPEPSWRANILAAVDSALHDVDALRARLKALRDDIEGADAINIPRQGRWTETMFVQLWERVSHLEGVRTLFELTGSQPGSAITFTDLINASGLDEQQQRNEHARMSRISAELFGSKVWPIENWQGQPTTRGGREEMRYRMPMAAGRWWRHTPSR